jgi:hypothetical protein
LEDDSFGLPDLKLVGSLFYSKTVFGIDMATASPQNLSVTYVIFPDETHASVSLAALGRALYFALKP